MKKTLLITFVTLFFLSSCTIYIDSSSSVSSGTTSNSISISQSEVLSSSDDSTGTSIDSSFIDSSTSIISSSSSQTISTSTSTSTSSISSGIDSSSSSSSSSTSSESYPSEPLNTYTEIDFYSLNDFHGSVVYDAALGEPGLPQLGAYFEQKESENPGKTVLVSAGDMWQGSADSNLTKGRLVTDGFGLLGFEAAAIGNHEFDWTDEIIRTNLERSQFPFLAANIFDKRTNLLADFAAPYTMINRQGVKIGIIGSIGPSLESSIQVSSVENYDFRTQGSYIIAAANQLEESGAHIIILINHDSNPDASVLPYVDAVFNGHSHGYQATLSSGVPNVMAYSNGKAVGHIGLGYNVLTDTVTTISYGVDEGAGLSLTPDPEMQTLYDSYYNTEIAEIKEEVVGTAVGTFTYSAVGNLGVEEMLSFGTSFGAQIAVHNTGGIRAEIPSGTVKYGDIYKALPFDNDLIVFTLTGSQLKNSWLSSNSYFAGVNTSTYRLTDGTLISNTGTYKVISISYLVENISRYPHDVSSEVTTGQFVRDLVRLKWLASGTLSASTYN